jgi:hypothetical protein
MSASNQAQIQMQQLHTKLEDAAKQTLEEVDTKYLRRVGRQTYACCVKCYDTAGSKQSSDVLEQCVRQCQQSHVMANNMIQEVCQCVDVLFNFAVVDLT